MGEHTYPKAFSHIGLTVPDLEKALQFYTQVMGWYLLMGPETVKEEKDSAIGQMCIDVFGEGWGEFKIAHLATSDKIGIELFEFARAPKGRAGFEPYKTGVFHFCVQDPNVEELAARIVAAGGKQRMPIRHYYPGEKPYRMVYMEDPFGNIIEIYSHSYELTYSKGAY
jgi:lactoylglutathione lyase family protein